MCLSSITETYEMDSPEYAEERTAYKVLEYIDEKLFPFIYWTHQEDDAYDTDGPGIEIGKWYTAELDPVVMHSGQSYLSGFHAYARLQAAKAITDDEPEGHAVVEVRISGVRMKGRQDGFVCFVADRMKIIKVVYEQGDAEE